MKKGPIRKGLRRLAMGVAAAGMLGHAEPAMAQPGPEKPVAAEASSDLAVPVELGGRTYPNAEEALKNIYVWADDPEAMDYLESLAHSGNADLVGQSLVSGAYAPGIDEARVRTLIAEVYPQMTSYDRAAAMYMRYLFTSEKSVRHYTLQADAEFHDYRGVIPQEQYLEVWDKYFAADPIGAARDLRYLDSVYFTEQFNTPEDITEKQDLKDKTIAAIGQHLEKNPAMPETLLKISETYPELAADVALFLLKNSQINTEQKFEETLGKIGEKYAKSDALEDDEAVADFAKFITAIRDTAAYQETLRTFVEHHKIPALANIKEFEPPEQHLIILEAAKLEKDQGEK
jgi:hypothetical protein